MGLESTDTGLDMEDLVNISKGHIMDRYQVFYIPMPSESLGIYIWRIIINESISALFIPQFSPSMPLMENAPGFKKHTTLKDMIHCVVYVVDTNKVSLLTEKMLDKFTTIRKKINQLG